MNIILSLSSSSRVWIEFLLRIQNCLLEIVCAQQIYTYFRVKFSLKNSKYQLKKYFGFSAQLFTISPKFYQGSIQILILEFMKPFFSRMNSISESNGLMIGFLKLNELQCIKTTITCCLPKST